MRDVMKKQFMQRFKMLNGAPETKPCKLCGNPLHLLRVNDSVVFWIHRGKDIKKCGELNEMYPGKPVVMTNSVSLYLQMEENWREVVEKCSVRRK